MSIYSIYIYSIYIYMYSLYVYTYMVYLHTVYIYIYIIYILRLFYHRARTACDCLWFSQAKPTILRAKSTSPCVFSRE